MFSGGSRYVYICPVLRSNSKFDVLKNSLSAGQLNSILPSVVSSGSLCSIRSPTLVLEKSGTYQSRAMVPFLHTNSLMASYLVLCSSTGGFVSGFSGPCNCAVTASFSMHCAMALVWMPVLSVDITVCRHLVCSLAACFLSLFFSLVFF